jgi:SAM-dependent methyltransferase
MKKWYRSWFNSPYYHILYANRDHQEAELFIDRLYDKLTLHENTSILDACCGKGRHSIYLNKKGVDVTGIDLSSESIQYAKQFENKKLHFFEHDIRNEFYTNTFDFVLNLFTSFGYFKRENENLKAIKVFSKALKPNGKLLVDFLNADKVFSSMKSKDLKTIDGIDFNIEKTIENGMIIKRIDFVDGGRHYEFKEEVKALHLQDFEKYFAAAGLTIIEKYGDYQLNDYQSNSSERLIMVAQRKND